jgi:hypothetical protein
MIIIDNVLVSDLLVEEQFVCNLSKCKGACCEDGDAGAPLDHKEKQYVKKYYNQVKPYMTKEGQEEVKKVGHAVYDSEFGWVTPTIKGGICAYGYKEKGVIKCAFEQAYNDGKIPWKKPISCHLFPIKIQKSKQDPSMEYVNYEPREDLCKSGCSLGVKLKVPAYQFLKESIVRKYGEIFYETLDATAKHLKNK